MAIILLFCSCDRDPTIQEIVQSQYDEVLSRLEFDCTPDSISKNNATAIIDGQLTCYHDSEEGFRGQDGYYFQPGFGAIFVTTSPVFNTGTTSGIGKYVSLGFTPLPLNTPFVEIFQIVFEGFPGNVTYEEIADSVFRVGLAPFSFEKYEWEYTPPSDYGVKIDVMSRYQKPGGNGLSGYVISSSYGYQPEDSRLEIVEVKKKDLADEVQYKVVLKFNCLLFHDYRFGNDELFGALEDGVMDVEFSVPKGK